MADEAIIAWNDLTDDWHLPDRESLRRPLWRATGAFQEGLDREPGSHILGDSGHGTRHRAFRVTDHYGRAIIARPPH